MGAPGLPRWLSDKEPPANAGDAGSIPGSGRSPGGGHGNLLQYSCLEKPMDRGAWQATVHGVAESDIIDRLSLTPSLSSLYVPNKTQQKTEQSKNQIPNFQSLSVTPRS